MKARPLSKIPPLAPHFAVYQGLFQPPLPRPMFLQVRSVNPLPENSHPGSMGLDSEVCTLNMLLGVMTANT